MFATKPETTITPLLLTAKEAARSLSVSERTLWAMTQAGEIPAVRRGRLVRYDRRDLEKWIESAKAS